MTVLVIREIRTDDTAGRGDLDSRMTSYEVINYESPTVRCVALPRLVIRENE